MILIISGIVLFLGVLFVILPWKPLMAIGIVFIIFSIFIGFLIIGLTFSVETEITIPQGAFIEKNENSIIVVVPNIGNKVITDPAVIRHLEVGDTIKVKKKYNSYGGQVDKTRIYVEKKGWKY